MPILDCDQLDASLAAAMRRFAATRAAERRRRETGRNLRFLFARLGFGFADLDALAAAKDGADLCPTLRARLMARLDGERRRLIRLARSGSALYDASRHLAIHTAAGWLEGGTAERGASDERMPGVVLNNRFRRGAAVRRAASPPPARAVLA